MTILCTPPLNLHAHSGLQQAILSPLRNLSSCESQIAQKRQLECVLQVLDSCGDSLKHAWPVVIGIIDDALTSTKPTLNANSIRTAFESIRMVVNDFLPTVPLTSFPTLMKTISNFCNQNVDVNICLTAIGLLWNMSDYISRNHTEISATLAAAPSPVVDTGTECTDNIPKEVRSEELWMTLSTTLASLCVDPRSDVRRSANQTLFQTVTMHGRLFDSRLWTIFIWEVLFPLLNNVNAGTTAAVAAAGLEVPQSDGGLMVHHSRDTPEKLWEETKVLALAGVARVFTTFYLELQGLPDFGRAWISLLDHLKQASFSASEEVSKTAVVALQEMCKAPQSGESDNEDKSTAHSKILQREALMLATATWEVWQEVCSTAANRRPVPSHTHLASLLDCCPLLIPQLDGMFGAAEAEAMMSACRAVIDLTHHDALTTSAMTPVQAAGLRAVLALVRIDEPENPELLVFVPGVLRELAAFVGFGCSPPPPPIESKRRRNEACVPFALEAMDKLAQVSFSQISTALSHTRSINIVSINHVASHFGACVCFT